VGVARSGAEAITERLQEAKALIVAANDPSVSDSDREKYQTDITELTASVQSIVDSASSNGQNLLKGVGSIDILSSLNPASQSAMIPSHMRLLQAHQLLMRAKALLRQLMITLAEAMVRLQRV